MFALWIRYSGSFEALRPPLYRALNGLPPKVTTVFPVICDWTVSLPLARRRLAGPVVFELFRGHLSSLTMGKLTPILSCV